MPENFIENERGENKELGTFEEIIIPLDENGHPTMELSDVLEGRTEQVVLVQNDPHDRKVREALSSPEIAEKLKNQGFEHYLILAPLRMQEILDTLEEGTVNLHSFRRYLGGPISNPRDGSFAEAIYAMSNSGMKVHAIDHNDAYSPEDSNRIYLTLEDEDRVDCLVENVKSSIGSDRGIILISNGFPLIGEIFAEDIPTLAQRLVEEGFDIVSVEFEWPETDPRLIFYNPRSEAFRERRGLRLE